MKLTQNQFYGRKEMMPREFTPGAQYITLDSKEIYIYDESGLPILVGSAGLQPSYSISEIDVMMDNKLNKDISTLSTITPPLLDTDKLIINRAGVDHSIDKSELIKVQEDYYTFGIPELVITANVLNTYFRNQSFNQYYRINATTSISDPLLVGGNYQAVLTIVPFDCYLEQLFFNGPSTNSDGSVLIIKTDPNSSGSPFTDNKVILFNESGLGSIQYRYSYNSGVLIPKNSAIHIFAKRSTLLSAWRTGLFMRFKKV